MSTPGALSVQILWQIGILVLCGISIWQIFLIPHLGPPPTQDFMQLSYSGENAKFRNGALNQYGVSGGIDAASQRRDMRVFLQVIVVFSLPSSILNLGKLMRRYNGIAAKGPTQKDWIDNCGDIIWGVCTLLD